MHKWKVTVRRTRVDYVTVEVDAPYAGEADMTAVKLVKDLESSCSFERLESKLGISTTDLVGGGPWPLRTV